MNPAPAALGFQQAVAVLLLHDGDRGSGLPEEKAGALFVRIQMIPETVSVTVPGSTVQTPVAGSCV